MRADNLSQAVLDRLKHYVGAHSAHRGVVPLPPTHGAVRLGAAEVGGRVAEAERALVRLAAYRGTSGTYFGLTCILERQKAISSCSIEGTNGTLGALLEVEQGGQSDGMSREAYGVTMALDYGLLEVGRHIRQAFRLETVLGLHAKLTKNMKGFRGVPGQISDESV